MLQWTNAVMEMTTEKNLKSHSPMQSEVTDPIPTQSGSVIPPKLTHHASTADAGFWLASEHLGSEACMSYRVDTYGGIILDSDALPAEADTFRSMLGSSLSGLSTQGFNRGYWIKIPVESIEFVPICVKEFGFTIHHARRSYVMLYRWSHPTAVDPIPPVSCHQVGVGCVILRGDGCIMLVKEKSGPAAFHGGIWKLPTGLAESEEDIPEAALREAKEETGLDCVFDSIICIRHSHGGSPSLGARSDIFFACLLKLVDPERSTPVLQETEILDAKWVHHSELCSVCGCGEGTSALRLMELVTAAAAGKPNAVIRGCKLPAWRRKNCDQWVYYPVGVHEEDNVCDILNNNLKP